jgi:hypothetical protein
MVLACFLAQELGIEPEMWDDVLGVNSVFE